MKIQLLQENDTEVRRKEIKILTLIESQWANEVCAQASSNLNYSRWNKEEWLPLTSDLKDYYVKDSFEQLNKDRKGKITYKILKQVIYCKIILMNRRIPAAVAQIKVEIYKSLNFDVQKTEFEGCLTDSGKFCWIPVIE